MHLSHLFLQKPTAQGGRRRIIRADLDDDYQSGVLQVDWPARLDLPFMNQLLFGTGCASVWLETVTKSRWCLDNETVNRGTHRTRQPRAKTAPLAGLHTTPNGYQ
jgi:hypothetical protein